MVIQNQEKLLPKKMNTSKIRKISWKKQLLSVACRQIFQIEKGISGVKTTSKGMEWGGNWD